MDNMEDYIFVMDNWRMDNVAVSFPLAAPLSYAAPTPPSLATNHLLMLMGAGT